MELAIRDYTAVMEMPDAPADQRTKAQVKLDFLLRNQNS